MLPNQPGRIWRQLLSTLPSARPCWRCTTTLATQHMTRPRQAAPACQHHVSWLWTRWMSCRLWRLRCDSACRHAGRARPPGRCRRQALLKLRMPKAHSLPGCSTISRSSACSHRSWTGGAAAQRLRRGISRRCSASSGRPLLLRSSTDGQRSFLQLRTTRRSGIRLTLGRAPARAGRRRQRHGAGLAMWRRMGGRLPRRLGGQSALQRR